MKKKIKVLNIVDSFGKGGAETLLLSLLKKHDRREFEWGVCGLLPPLRGTLLPEFQQQGISCYDLGISFIESFIKNPLKALNRWQKLIKGLIDVFCDFQPDIVHTHLFWPSFLSNLLFAHKNIRLVTTYHSIIFPEKIKAFLLKLSILYAHPVCIACSEAVFNAIISQKYVPKKLAVTIPNSVDVDVFNPQLVSLPSENPFRKTDSILKVLQVGSLVKEKGHRYTIEAVSLLKEQNMLVEVCCAGEGTYKKDLIDYAIVKGVADRVHFLGARNDVKELLKACDVFVLPSHWEGLSIAQLEAMSMELPVVVSAVGGALEVIKDGVNGFLIPLRDSVALAEKLKILANAPLIRQAIGKAARQTVIEKYSIERQVHSLEKIYRELIKKV